MAKYNWDSPNITGNQIVEGLISQYGVRQHVSVELENMDKPVSYKNSLIPLHCNRCDSSFTMSPKFILDAYYLKGYICSNCGSLSNEELRKLQHEKMLEGAVDVAKEHGIDLDALEAEKKAKEDEEKSLGYTKEDYEDLYGTVSEEETSTESTTPVKEEVKSTPKSITPTVENTVVPPAKKVEPVVEEVEENEQEDEDDVSKYMYDESEDSMSLEDAISQDEINNIFDEDYDDEPESEENVEDDVSTVVEPVASTESVTPVKEEVKSTPKSITPTVENTVVPPAKKVEPVVEEVEEKNSEPPKETFTIGNKEMTVDEIRQACEEAEKTVYNKIGFWPYRRKLAASSGKITLTCEICGKDVEFDDFSKVVSGITVLSKEYCASRGIQYRQNFGKDATIHYCPTCIKSVVTDGCNKYLKHIVKTICKNAHLNIVDDGKYWYTGYTDKLVVEANGVSNTMTIKEIVSKYSEGRDARNDKEFTPRGTATKSETAASKSTESFTTTKSSTETKTQGFRINNAGAFNSKIKDSNSKLDAEMAKQKSEIEENNVFKINQEIKNDHSTIARLNERCNPFTQAKSLESSFQRSVFSSFIHDLSQETHVECTLIVNSKTYEIPIIDFENGFRLICVDIDDNSMTKIPYNIIAKCVSFSYRDEIGRPMTDYSTMVLFSDAVERRRDATFDALVKYINPKILPYKGAKIELTDTIFTQYTDYKPYLKEFDAQCSSFPAGKPKNGQLGIIATWAEDDGKVDYRDIMKFQTMLGEGSKSGLNQLTSDYSQYMVASIKYIERLNKDTGRVIYTITDYVEIGSAIIADGLLQCVRALLREYSKKYPSLTGIAPHIIVELDPNVFPSPSIKSYIKRGSLCPVDDVYKSIVDGSGVVRHFGKDQFLKYTYVRKAEYRSPNKDSDWCRQDMRMFGAGTLAHTMADELRTAGVSAGIADDNTRLAFINNMGFVKNNQLEVKEYFFDQVIIESLLMDGKTGMMQKLPDPEQSFGNASGLVNSSADGFNINNVMSNPALMNKYFNIVRNATPEAKEYFMNNVVNPGAMQNPYQQNYGMYNPMQQQMNASPNTMQQPMGVNPMMGGMGMGMQMPGMGMMGAQQVPGMGWVF